MNHTACYAYHVLRKYLVASTVYSRYCLYECIVQKSKRKEGIYQFVGR